MSRRQEMPRFVKPQLAVARPVPPEGRGWIHEVKFDGYRSQIRVEHGSVGILTRRGADWTEHYPHIAAAARHLPDCLIDGEAVVLDKHGVSDFELLQAAVSTPKSRTPILFFAFDLLFREGSDLRSLPLIERKARLEALLEPLAAKLKNRIRIVPHFGNAGDEVKENACRLGLEGIVSKRANARYASTRNDDWIKSTCGNRDTFLLGGWREQGGEIMSLMLGETRGGKFAFVGKARQGFQAQAETLYPQLLAHEAPTIQFDIGRPERKDTQRWLKPELQAEISFRERTSGGKLRHARFIALREDLASSQSKRGEQRPRRERFGNVQRLLHGAAVPSDEALRAYWKRVGKKALKYLARRPLSLVRHQGNRVFFHTGVLPPVPDTIRQLTVAKREGGEGMRLWVESVAGLMDLAQLGVIELHPWSATVDDIEHPVEMVFDLDPGGGIEWPFVCETALSLRDFLKGEEGLATWAKVTGGKGLHVTAPLDGSRTHDQIRAYARRIVGRFAARDPRYITVANLEARPGRLFLDYLRNGRGATAIGAYSPRARPGFPVAMPVTWAAVEKGIQPDAFRMDSVKR